MLPYLLAPEHEADQLRCFELKHELNGVSYAADVSAPRKV